MLLMTSCLYYRGARFFQQFPTVFFALVRDYHVCASGNAIRNAL